MILQGMIFALGFLVSTLLALLVLPAVSRRAVRLATARLRMLVPLSMTEIAAERDQIRAGHAVAVRRLEQQIERSNGDKAGLMAEAGRTITRLTSLAGEHERLATRHEAQASELDRAVRAARETEAESGLQMQVLHDAFGLAERRLIELHATEGQLAAVETLSDQRRASLAALETRGTGQDLRIRDLAAQLVRAAADLHIQRAAREAVTRERDEARAAAERVVSDRDRDVAALRDLSGEERERRTALEAERDRLAAAVDRLERQAASAASARAASEDDLAVLRRTIVALGAELLQFAEAEAPQGGSSVPEGAIDSDGSGSPKAPA